MKKILILSAVLAVVAIGLIVGNYEGQSNDEASVEIRKKEFRAELARTPKQREKGLGKRAGICGNCGMLFLFEKEGVYPFWMKDMTFDIDMIWILRGKIVYIAKNISHLRKDIIDPGVAADKVLEINAGLSDEYGFELGDLVK